MNATPITLVGGITADPESRTAGTTPVATFSIAVTPRQFDRQANEWRDGETTYWNCEAFGALAEAILGEYRKGSQVLATGTVTTQRWADRTSGEKRERLVFKVDAIGTKLRAGTRQPTDAWASQASTQGQQPAADWAAQQPPQGSYDNTPF